MTSRPTPASSTSGRIRRWVSGRSALGLAATLVASLGAVAGFGLLSAGEADPAQLSCDSSLAAVVRYVVGPNSVSEIVVRSIVVSGLPAGCDGDPVVVDLYGNGAGDPRVPLAQDEMLAQADSTLDPCTQQALMTPGRVTRGGVALSLCPSGGRAGVVSVHDLTAVALRVAGDPVATTGQTSGDTKQALATSASEGGGRGELAFTGAQIAFAVSAGLLVLLAGTLLVVLSRILKRKAAQRRG